MLQNQIKPNEANQLGRTEMNIDDINKLSETLKNTIVAIAVVIGGIWSLHIFNEKLEAKKAESELVKLKQELIQRPLVQGMLDVKSIYIDAIGEWVARIEITLVNNGDVDSYLNLDQNSIRVARADFEEGLIASYSDVKYNHITYISEPYQHPSNLVELEAITLLAGHEKTFESLVRISSDGVYQINFIAKLGAQAHAARKLSGVLDFEEFDTSDFALYRTFLLNRKH